MPDPDPRRSEDESRKGAHPIVWLLVLIALLIAVWALYNQIAGTTTSALIRSNTTTPPQHQAQPAQTPARQP